MRSPMKKILSLEIRFGKKGINTSKDKAYHAWNADVIFRYTRTKQAKAKIIVFIDLLFFERKTKGAVIYFIPAENKKIALPFKFWFFKMK